MVFVLMDYLEVCCSICKYFYYWFLFILWWENIILTISVLCIYWDLFYGPTYSLLWRIFHVHLKEHVCCSCWVDCSTCVRLSWLLVLFKFPVALLPMFLLISESWALKSSARIVWSSIFPSSSVLLASCVLRLCT